MSIYRNSLETLVDVTGIEPATPCLQIGGEPFLMEYDDLLSY